MTRPFAKSFIHCHWSCFRWQYILQSNSWYPLRPLLASIMKSTSIMNCHLSGLRLIEAILNGWLASNQCRRLAREIDIGPKKGTSQSMKIVRLSLTLLLGSFLKNHWLQETAIRSGQFAIWQVFFERSPTSWCIGRYVMQLMLTAYHLSSYISSSLCFFSSIFLSLSFL